MRLEIKNMKLRVQEVENYLAYLKSYLTQFQGSIPTLSNREGIIGCFSKIEDHKVPISQIPVNDLGRFFRIIRILSHDSADVVP
jgi:hypothetical protein